MTGTYEVIVVGGGANGRVEPPGAAGGGEGFGRDVLHCPYCHGREVRGQACGVLASTSAGVHQALVVSQRSKDVTLFPRTVTEHELPDEDLRRLTDGTVDDHEVLFVAHREVTP